MAPSREIARLIEIMAALRTPGTGCPWDLIQDFRSILPYTIEEAYEVADAIERDDRVDLQEELGDLLLQVVYHARLAEEEGAFDFGDVVAGITAKLIRRHPHVFGGVRDLPPETVKALWNQIKTVEKAERAGRLPAPAKNDGLLGTVPGTFPPLLRALKLQAKASTVGFDWNDTASVLGKIREELDEVTTAVASSDRAAITDEIGDLLFSVVNLARHAEVDPEQALRGTNAKFVRRFSSVEKALEARGSSPEEATLADMEALWTEAKRAETGSV